jgi:hypothetical protein
MPLRACSFRTFLVVIGVLEHQKIGVFERLYPSWQGNLTVLGELLTENNANCAQFGWGKYACQEVDPQQRIRFNINTDLHTINSLK